MTSRDFIRSVIAIVVPLLVAGFFVARGGWYYDANQPPPGGNLGVPIDTVSSTGQIKAGGLTINTGGANTGLVVSDDRRTSWDSYFTGVVGIGTNSPFEKLDLKGNLKISGLLMPLGNYGSDDQVLSGVPRVFDPELNANLQRFDWQNRKRWMTLAGEPGIIPCSIGSGCSTGTCSGSQNEWPIQCENLGWTTYTYYCLPETGAIAPDGKNYYEVRIHICYQ